MTIGSTSGRVLIAAIPVAAMLFIEVGLPFLRKCWGKEDEHPDEEGIPQDYSAAALRTSAGDVPRSRPASRWHQNGRYYQILHQTANSGNMASMDKLGELALVRRDFVEAFYWKLMVELHGGRSHGVPAWDICRAWLDAGCSERAAEGEGGLFTEDQEGFAMAVLNLWNGLHVRTSTETIRQMVREGHVDAIRFERKFGFEGV